MFKIYSWLKKFSLLIGVLIIIISILNTEKKYSQKKCKNIQVVITDLKNSCFLEKKNIFSYLSTNSILSLNTTPIVQIISTKIENIIKSHKFVRSCKVYKTCKGDLKIIIEPKQVIARIIRPGETDYYVDEIGDLLPLSPNYTAKVVLIDINDKLYKLENNIQTILGNKHILELLQLINADYFWNAQIIHIAIDDKKEIILTPKFGKQKIYFGKSNNIKNKMKKLRLFYKFILPYKGWNAYKKIHIKFDNQIVCE